MAMKADSDFTPAPPISEPCVVPDVFCSELVKIERIGPCVRLVFAVLQHVHCGDGSPERVIIAKVVMPAEAAAALSSQIDLARVEHEVTQRRPISAVVN